MKYSSATICCGIIYKIGCNFINISIHKRYSTAGAACLTDKTACYIIKRNAARIPRRFNPIQRRSRSVISESYIRFRFPDFSKSFVPVFIRRPAPVFYTVACSIFGLFQIQTVIGRCCSLVQTVITVSRDKIPAVRLLLKLRKSITAAFQFRRVLFNTAFLCIIRRSPCRRIASLR